MDALLRSLVEYAALAPSGHNAQPWRFRLRDGGAELLADRTRALPVVDPDDRELVISCGAALGVMRVAVRHFGHEADIEILPDPADPDVLARVRVGPPHVATDRDEALFRAIAHRHTNRRPFDERPVPRPLLRELTHIAAAGGAWLRVVTAPGLKAVIADLVAEGDRHQAADPAFRRELASWMRPNRTRQQDGMPGYTQGIGDAASVVMPAVIRMVDWGRKQAAADRALAVDSPTLLLLGTAADTPRDWLRTGQALSLVLLSITAAGVSASFLNQPIEVPPLRARLAQALGLTGTPQLLLRLGYGPATRATPRREVAAVIDG